MKNLTYLLFALFLFIVAFEACDKQALAPQYQGKLVASSTSVNPNEADSLIVVGADNETVTWDVSPKTYTIVKKENNKIILTFQEYGAYTITATVNGKPLTIYVGCWANGTTTHVSLTDVNIVITPHYYRSKSNPSMDSTYFSLTAEIQKVLACNSGGVNLQTDRTNNNFLIIFGDITQPDGQFCLPPTSTAYQQVTIPYDQDADPSKRYLLNVSYPLIIKKGGTTYTGSVIFTNTAMDITWNYTSGVTFTSKHVTF
ncbi:hypothetical protein [Mucilaginibacter sp. UYCu711]|uniref:hypothetical protein n=1 Tax=Mucilaginibacter sp. UYCu711 TaxID=3156339 RepID=UPI003D24EF98